VITEIYDHSVSKICLDMFLNDVEFYISYSLEPTEKCILKVGSYFLVTTY